MNYFEQGYNVTINHDNSFISLLKKILLYVAMMISLH